MAGFQRRGLADAVRRRRLGPGLTGEVEAIEMSDSRRGRWAARGRWAVVGAALGVGAQVGPAATWLAPVRSRLAPSLDSPMPAGSLALTFDDGPHPLGTPAVLDQLDALGWHATFFVLGRAAVADPGLLREVVARGHAVGVHGYDHRYLIARTPRDQSDDLCRAVEVTAAMTGTAPSWWRPPYGVLSGPALVAAHRLGVRPVLWSAWGRDWEVAATAESIVRTVTRGRLDGGTVLLHDSDATSAEGSWRRTVAALPLLADELDARGLRVAPLRRRLA